MEKPLITPFHVHMVYGWPKEEVRVRSKKFPTMMCKIRLLLFRFIWRNSGHEPYLRKENGSKNGSFWPFRWPWGLSDKDFCGCSNVRFNDLTSSFCLLPLFWLQCVSKFTILNKFQFLYNLPHLLYNKKNIYYVSI